MCDSSFRRIWAETEHKETLVQNWARITTKGAGLRHLKEPKKMPDRKTLSALENENDQAAGGERNDKLPERKLSTGRASSLDTDPAKNQIGEGAKVHACGRSPAVSEMASRQLVSFRSKSTEDATVAR